MNVNKEEEQTLLAIAQVEGVGIRTLQKMLEWRARVGANLGETWAKRAWPVGLFANKPTIERVNRARQDVILQDITRQFQQLSITPVYIWQDQYPRLLKETEFAPPILYCRGELSLLTATMPIAVVGARKMTAYGKKATLTITKELTAAGATVISGFMYGVDVTAHLAALGAGGGSIAVLGFGLDQMYPTSQTELYHQLLKQKMLFISQFPLGTSPQPGNFLQRNSLVAGLSHAVVVTEAGFPSGSFSTAQVAVDEGRLVCAVPGPFDSDFSQGTKWLINEGAVLVTAGWQVLEELGFPIANDLTTRPGYTPTKNLAQLLTKLDNDQKQVFNLVIEHSGDIEKIIQATDYPTQQLSAILTELEIMGLLERVGESWQIVL